MSAIQFILSTILCSLVVTSVTSSLLPHAHLLPAVSPLHAVPVARALPPPVLFNYPRSIHAIAPAVAPAVPALPTAFGLTAPALAPAPAIFPHFASAPAPAVLPHIAPAPVPAVLPHAIPAPAPAFLPHAVHASPALPHFAPAQIPAALPHFAPAFAPAISAPVVPALTPSIAFARSVPYSVPPFAHQVNVLNKVVPAVFGSPLVKHFTPTAW